MRNPKRRIPYFAGLFTKDCTQKLFFGRKLGFALWRHLSNEDIARVHLGANADNSPFVKVFQRVVTYIWNVTRYFLLAKLGIPGLKLVFSICMDVNTSFRTSSSLMSTASS